MYAGCWPPPCVTVGCNLHFYSTHSAPWIANCGIVWKWMFLIYSKTLSKLSTVPSYDCICHCEWGSRGNQWLEKSRLQRWQLSSPQDQHAQSSQVIKGVSVDLTYTLSLLEYAGTVRTKKKWKQCQTVSRWSNNSWLIFSDFFSVSGSADHSTPHW